MEIQTTRTILIASFLIFFVIGIIFTIVFMIVHSKIMEQKEASKIKGFGEKGYYPETLKKTIIKSKSKREKQYEEDIKEMSDFPLL